MLMIAPLSSNRLLALCRELSTCSDPAPSAAGQHSPEAHLSLDTINPWSWLRFVKLVQWSASLTVCGLGHEVIR